MTNDLVMALSIIVLCVCAFALGWHRAPFAEWLWRAITRSIVHAAE